MSLIFMHSHYGWVFVSHASNDKCLCLFSIGIIDLEFFSIIEESVPCGAQALGKDKADSVLSAEVVYFSKLVNVFEHFGVADHVVVFQLV